MEVVTTSCRQFFIIIIIILVLDTVVVTISLLSFASFCDVIMTFELRGQLLIRWRRGRK